MNVVDVLRDIEREGATPIVRGGKLVVEGPALSDKLRATVRQHRVAMIEFLTSGRPRQFKCGRCGAPAEGLIRPPRCLRDKSEFVECLPPQPKAKPPTWKERLERRRAERAKEVR
jgi:hypothetical protein